MRYISHHKTRENFIITLFTAIKSKSKDFSSVSKLVVTALCLLLFVLGSFYVYAQSNNRALYKIETIHVFPDKVVAEGWKNAEQIGTQNLEESSLYQEFNTMNSAYIDINDHPKYVFDHRNFVPASDEETTASRVEEVENDEVVDTQSDATSTSTATEEVSNDVLATSTGEVTAEGDKEEGVVPVSETEESASSSTDIFNGEAVLESEINEAESASGTVSVGKKATDIFSYAFSSMLEWLPFAQSGTTSQTTTPTTTEVATEEVLVDELLLELPSDLSAATETDTVATGTEGEIVEAEVATTTATTTPVATTTQIVSDEVVDATSTVSTTSTLDNVIHDSAEEVSDVPLCERDCAPYTITLSGFGLPIFDETTKIDGAHLRMSFGAKRRVTRDEIQSLSLNYSFDDGESWIEGGDVLVDEETSNSINGGYFLFALPAITDPTVLDSLIVELRYENDPRVLEGIYIDSVWLELFTIEPPEDVEVNIAELLADDGYDPTPLSGDQLVLPTGEVLQFENTDDNDGETLIIKSDSLHYSGLTRAVTYFNVTNTDTSADTFNIKTYFPQGVGQVRSLEVWNQNKPQEIVIPEYRSYVYHCDGGWELTDNPLGEDLFEISRQLAPQDQLEIVETASSTPETEALSTTTPVEVTGPASTTAPATTSDTTASSTEVQAIIDSAQRFAQATVSTTTGTTTDSGVGSEEDEVEEEVLTYICRETNVVRTCDALDVDNTGCVQEDVKVAEHPMVKYQSGWEQTVVGDGVPEDTRSLLKRTTDFLGFGPDEKEIPSMFEVSNHSVDAYEIAPGETKFFKLEIEFPAHSQGEFWIEAVGDSEYGLLDPFWSSQWQYRIPISIDNTNSNQTLSEYQVFLELDNALTDFWTNVSSDGGDIRFVQETVAGNEEDWYGTGWGRRTPITIQSSQVDENLTDFPVYVDLADLGSGFFSTVQGDGDDIRITESDGLTELPYELVAINKGGETGELHFKANSVSSSTDTTFYIYHDNPNVNGYAATDTYGGENVWDSSHIAVYHLEEDAGGRGNTGLYQDSTNNEYDADDELNSTGKSGKLGQGQEIDAQGDGSEYMLLPSDIVNSESQLAFTYWMNSSEAGNQALINGGANNEFLLYMTGGGTSLQFFPGSTIGITDLSASVWRHVLVTRDSGANQWRIFIDGVEDDNSPSGASLGTLSIPSDCLVLGLEQDGSCLSSGDTSQHLNANIDEMRFWNTIPSDGEITATYRNQATTTDFYSVGSPDIFSSTTFVELDFWIQHFDYSGQESDIWVQTESLAANASSTIYLYYGSSGATSASDEEATFTYSTTTDLYYVVNGASTGAINVYSYVDNNMVLFDGASSTPLDAGETIAFTGYSSSTVISALGPIAATIDDAYADTIAPIAFATTTHAVATNRGTSEYYIHSPFASTTVRTYIGGSGTADQTLNVATGTAALSTTDASSGNEGVIIEADSPILVFHKTSNQDSLVAYPPTTLDIFGIDSSNPQVTTLTDNPDPDVYCSSIANGTTTGLTRGEEQTETSCAASPDGAGDAVRFTGALYPITSIQEADGDGGEASVFWPQHEFATEYIMTTDSAYAAVVCSPRFGTVNLEIQTSGGSTVESGTCTPTGEYPGKAYFTNGQDGDDLAFTAGHKVVSTNGVPFYVVYEDDEEDNDETNILSYVHARKNKGTETLYSFGAQEVSIDAQYEQLSFAWYENTNDETPTSSWSIGGGETVTEGDAITGQGAVNDGDVLRLRMNLLANSATGSASSSAFVLQYAAANTCSTASNWQEIGLVGSTTAAFSGYNNSAVDDGETLSSTTLASSTVFATYEEASPSEFIPNEIGIGEVAEWDWVFTSSNASVNTNYCFRMVRSSGEELMTYTSYPELETAGPPGAATLFERFDNEHASSVRPTLEFSASDLSGDDLHYYVEIDDDVNFGSPILQQNSETNFLQFENVVSPSDKAPFNSGQRVRYTPSSDLVSSTTYWWRVRSIDPDGSNTFSTWSSERSFTINESVTVSEWYQTTDEQFETNSLISATTSGSGSVELDIGSSIIGEYGSQEVGNGVTTTISYSNSYTDPIVVASIRYPRSVGNGDQRIVRVVNKGASDFDVLAIDDGYDAAGSSTIDYMVMESGEYLIEDGGTGQRVYATSTSVSSYQGGGGGNPSTDVVTFPTSFSGSPTVIAMVTSNNDADWVVASVYSGSSATTPPSASEVKLYLNDTLYSDGHSSAEDVDVIAFDQGSGTNNSVDFNVTTSGSANVTDSPTEIGFDPDFSTVPETVLVQSLTNNGGDGGYAMVDTDNPVTAATATVAIDEGTTGGRGHGSAEEVGVIAFDSAGGDITRAGNAQITSTAIDFDDVDVGNAWGEVSFTDSGDVTYHIEYQTGSGFADIPDSALPGNSTGFTSSPVNILDLDTDTYNQIRLVANMTGVDPELFDWTVTWGQRVDIPDLGDPFDNEKVSTTTPTFDFVSTDPQGDDLEYEISWSTDNTFTTGSTTRNSSTSAGFLAGNPYGSGVTVTFTIQSGDALTDNETYWWRVRAKDPNGGDAWSPWSNPDSFTVDTSTLVSTWFQTTQEQFTEGSLNGTIASTSDAIEVPPSIGVYGTTTLTDSDWQTITTDITFDDMVVVAKPSYDFDTTAENSRTVRVRNKTTNSFEVRVESESMPFSGTTTVDFIAIERGDWTLEDGSSGLRVVADTAYNVSAIKGQTPGYGNGQEVLFDPVFTGGDPGAILTIVSDNSSKWVTASMDDGSGDAASPANDINADSMFVGLEISVDSETSREAEDIDYIAFAEGQGTNDSTLFDFFNSGDTVGGSSVPAGVNYNQSFSSAPQVVLAQVNGMDGGAGGEVIQETGVASTNSTGQFMVVEIPSDNGHTNEVISIMAFEAESGEIVPQDLGGTVASEPILFSDGFGPKFEQALFSTTNPGNSSTSVQVQYLTSTSSWAMIPDSQIPGNSTGTTTSPIDLTNVNIVSYPTIRLLATLQCDGTDCPTLEDWSIEWSEGVPLTGTVREYDRSTAVTSGTVQVAVNNLSGNTGAIQGDGTFTINNVTAFEGDTITVWVSGAAEADEAVTVFTYDGVGDMTGVELFEQHLSISSAENATTTNYDLAAYDNSVSGNEDIFFDVDSNNDLTVCAIGSCLYANLYIGSGDIYQPATSTSEVVSMHDFVNVGTVDFDANTFEVSGSWQNSGVINIDTSTVTFTATTSSETINDNDNVLEFNNLTFGQGSGSADWKTSDPLDIAGALSVTFGTLDRSSSTIDVEGALSTGASGYWSGISTTTFDGSGSVVWTDANTNPQNIGYVVVDGSAKTVVVGTDVQANSITIGADDTLDGGGAFTIGINGNFTNNNNFLAKTSALEINGTTTVSVVDTGGDNLYTFRASTTDGGSVSFASADITILDNFEIATGTVTMPTATTTIGGSFSNTGGVFAHNNAAIRFNGAGTETIELQGTEFLNAFYNVLFSGSGSWTFLDTSATTTNRLNITGGTVVLPAGQLTIGRNFTTSGSGAFNANGGEVVFLIEGNDVIATNGSSFNDVRIRTGSGGSGAWYDENWLYRLPVTVQSSQIDDDLSNFPVYIDLSDLPSAFFSNLNSDGGDIRVTESDGVTEVPREVVSASTTAETGELYFEATSISSSTDSVFYIYYGNSGASEYAVSDTYGAENVWANGYVLVVHSDDETTSTVVNSANGSFDGTKDASNSPQETDLGKIYEGQDYEGAGHIGFGNVGSGATNITISAWINPSNLTGSGDTNTYGYSIFSAHSAGAYTWLTVGGTGGGGSTDEVRFCAFSSSATCNVASGSNIGTDEWHYVSASAIDGGAANVRVDGSNVLSFTSNGGGTWNSGSTIGDLRPDRDIEFEGLIDEVQISNVVRSTAWQDATYRNQGTTTDFYAVGSPQQDSVRTFTSTNVDATGDVVIESGSTVFPTGIFSIGGSFDNNDQFDSNAGTVTFTATSGSQSIAAGNSSFSSLIVNGNGGSFTVTEHATATNSIVLTDANLFTVNTGITLDSVGGFTNQLQNASTTWTGATLRLSGGTDFALNDKSNEGDTYNILTVTGDGDIGAWNSTASTYDLQDTASFYSQDHAGTDGDLYIFGDYIRESGTEYWSYATDFDGADLMASSSERQVDVRIANGGSVSIATSTLELLGDASASTTIDAQSGTFALTAEYATVTAQYFTMTGTDATGFNLTSSTTVTSFDNSLFSIGAASAAITVDASTIDTNPASQFFGTDFVTGGGNVNVTLSGSPVSYWWFRDGVGDRYGEAFDNADGNPGSIRWDDSAYTINISGTIYADDGSSTLGGPTCNGFDQNVRIVVDGGTFASSTTCNGANGSYLFPGVNYVGDPSIIVYLDTDGGERGAVITKTPTADITDLNIYADRVMTRHENTAVMTIADMVDYDEDDDTDIPFVAATGTPNTLVVRPDTELIVASSTTFAPDGNITLQSGGTGNVFDGSLHIDNNATFTAAGTESHSIGGSLFRDTGGTFTAASTTFDFTSTTTGRTITSGDITDIDFYGIQFTGVGGGWNVNTNITATSNITVATGTVTGTGDITLTDGPFTGAGLVSMGGGTVLITSSTDLGGIQGWTFNNLTLGDGSTTSTTTRSNTATTTIAGVLTIANAHFLDVGSSQWQFTGSDNVFVETGTFLEGTSVVTYGGSLGSTVLSTTYHDLRFAASGGTPTFTFESTALNVLNDLTVAGAVTTTATLATNDPLLQIDGDVYIGSNGVLVGSDTTPLTVLGSWDNNGTFTASGGEVAFTSTDAFTIAAGSSDFADLTITGTGTVTFTENATSSGALTFATNTVPTVNPGVTLAVGTEFNHETEGVNTTWTDATLYLYGGDYEVNASTTADTYGTLLIGTGAEIRTWNSTAATTTVNSSGSLYSMDHADVTGDLYIFGTYTNESRNDYWNYATDFDGTDLSGGSERQVDVYIEAGGAVSYDGGDLDILGTTSASTTIQVQGTGDYSFDITAGTLEAEYYEFNDLDSDGVTFSGSPTVTSLSYGEWLLDTTGDAALTVAASVIDQNPGRNILNNRFATTSGVTNAVNVRTSGAPVSSWRYNAHYGDVDGEDFDDDTGDPGYIVWDNSTTTYAIGGTVYQNDRSTPSTACGGTANLVLVVNTVAIASTTCNGSGVYQFEDVNFDSNDNITVYINGEPENAVVVTKEPISSVSNMDLYEDHVIVRHENTNPLSIADMAIFDSSDDNDIQFTAVDAGTDTLTIPADNQLLIWTSKEFAPAGDITLSGGGGGSSYDGTLEALTSGTFTGGIDETYTIAGNITFATNANFDAGSSTAVLTSAASGRTVDVNEDAFNNLSFTGSGSWSISDTSLTVNRDLVISSGVVTLPAATTTIGSSFINSGTFDANGGLLLFVASTSGHTITFGGSDTSDIEFSGASGAWTITDANATTTGSFTVASGTPTLPSGIYVVDEDFIVSDNLVHNNGTLVLSRATGTATVTLSTNDLNSLVLRGGATFEMSDSAATLLGDFIVASGTVNIPTTTLSIGGSLDAATGVMNTASGTVHFISGDTGETIDPGNNNFYNVLFGNGSGGWTITADATTTNNFTLSTAANFTQSGGTTLSVGGVFTNYVGGSATTWSNTTLRLVSGSEYSINTKAVGGDDYETLYIAPNTDIRAWDSQATTTSVDSSSSFYSQDHAAQAGNLYIFGDFEIATGTEYWSYATDFDGAALGGSSRPVNVYHATSATTTLATGGALEILGNTSATTTMQSMGTETWAFAVTGGSWNAQYFALRDLDASGLNLSGAPTIVSLSNGDFEISVDTGYGITLASTTLNANPSFVIENTRFATTSGVNSGFNVNLGPTTTAAWIFSEHYGNFDGETYDNDGTGDCGSLRWDDSSCEQIEQTAFRWRNDDGGLAVPDSEWYDSNWDKRKRVRFVNADNTEYLNAPVKFTVDYVVSMRTDFEDLRFTDDSGTTSIDYWLEKVDDGTSATVWVEIPSLPAQDTANIFMYYDNSTATTTSSSTTVFPAVDDFEDNDLDEYNGQSSTFDVDTEFNFGGTYGLDLGSNEGTRLNYGIARFDQASTSQGQTIRYMQYVDTSAGSSDEACTLFGVQYDVDDSQNYGVCLELFGTDRITLAKDIESTDTYGSVEQLSSSTLTYSTGWYEIEVDWQTDNTIFVSLYNEAGTLIATTSGTDSTYTEGGYGFTSWGQNGGWDGFTARPLRSTEPTVLFGVEQTDGGASWAAAQNEVADTFEIGETARLRIAVENTGLNRTDQYAIEYAAKGVAPSCASVSGASFTGISDYSSCGTDPVCMATSTIVSDGASTIDLLEIDSNTFTPGSFAEDPSTISNSITIDQNEYTELEYTLSITPFTSDQSYCFRVTDNGSELDSYTSVAELRVQSDPIFGAVTFNLGDPISLVGGTTTRVYATATVTDLNGYTDLVSASSTMFTTTATAACTADDNNCYISTTSPQCTFTDCSGNSCILSCYSDFLYHASPTDAIGDPDEWFAFLEATDAAGGSNFNTSPGIELLTLRSIEVTSTISYGALEVYANTGSYNPTTTIENIGNVPVDVDIEGTDMSDGLSSAIPAEYQVFGDTPFTYGACGGCVTVSSTAAISIELDLTKPTTTAISVEDDIYWGLEIPFGTASNPHTGNNTFTPVPE